MPNRKSKEYIEKVLNPILDEIINNPVYRSFDDIAVELSVKYDYLAEELFENKQYVELSSAFFKIADELPDDDEDEYFFNYETSYSLAQVGYANELWVAEEMCEFLLDFYQEDQAMLNKLSELKNIIDDKKKLDTQ